MIANLVTKAWRAAKVLRRYHGKLRYSWLWNGLDYELTQWRVSKKALRAILFRQLEVTISIGKGKRCLFYKTVSGRISCVVQEVSG